METPGANATGRYIANWLEDGEYDLNPYPLRPPNLCRSCPRGSWTYAVTNENEWYKAAFYQGDGTYSRYAHGGNAINNLPPPGDAFSANYDSTGPQPVGSYIHTRNHYGTFDMDGNLSESKDGGYEGPWYGSSWKDDAARTTSDWALQGYGTPVAIRLVSKVPDPVCLIDAEISGAVELTWQSVDGQEYRIVYSSDLINWIPEAEVIIGDGAEMKAYRLQDAARAFFQIELLAD